MTELGLWLKQLVLMVILAVFADLLLPTKSMQKYVRMVMGLAIIAAMLQPVLPLLRGHWGAELANTLAGEVASSSDARGTVVAPSTANELRQTLQSEQQQNAQELLQKDVAVKVQNQFQLDYVPVVQVTGNLTQWSHVQMVVILAASETKSIAEVKSWLQTTLHLAASQVTVQREGGGTS